MIAKHLSIRASVQGQPKEARYELLSANLNASVNMRAHYVRFARPLIKVALQQIA